MKTKPFDNNNQCIHIDIMCPCSIDEETQRGLEVGTRGAANGVVQFTEGWNNTKVYSRRTYHGHSEKVLIVRVDTPVGFPPDKVVNLQTSIKASAIAQLCSNAGWSMSESRNGVRVEAVPQKVVAPMVEDTNPLRAFIAECCEPSDERVQASRLLSAYKAWRRVNSGSRDYSPVSFASEMERLGYTKVDHRGSKLYVGLRLIEGRIPGDNLSPI